MVHLLQCSSSVHAFLLLLFFFSDLVLTSSMEVEDRRLLLPVKKLQPPQDTGDGANKAVVVAADCYTNKQEAAAAGGIGGGRGGTEVRRRRRRALIGIGSRPPRCERVCISCGHCEAVQVPVVPLPQLQAKSKATSAAMFAYRVDGITNYKPLSWKCRCGGTILDP